MKISKAHQRKSALVEEAKEDFATIGESGCGGDWAVVG